MTAITAPKWLKAAGIIALLWNLMGLTAFISDCMMSPETLEKLDPAMSEAYQNSPTWNWIAYAVAVICGVLGSIMLLMKKKAAYLLLTLSLIGVLVQNYYGFVVTGMYQEMGGGAFIMPMLIVLISIALFFISRKGTSEGWLS